MTTDTPAATVHLAALNVRDTTNCAIATACELCEDATATDLGVVVWVNGSGLGACVTCCVSCSAAPIPADAELSLYGRALEHAAHLGTPAELMVAVGTVRSGGQLTDTAAIPLGPFPTAPTTLAWVVTAGHTIPADRIDPGHLDRWLRAVLDECAVTTEPGEQDAIAELVALGPEAVQVVGGLIRRSRGARLDAAPVTFDPATALQRATDRRVAHETQAAQLRQRARDDDAAEQAAAEARGVFLEQPDSIAEQLADEAAADLARRVDRHRAGQQARR